MFCYLPGANRTPHASHSTQPRSKRIIGLFAFECDFNIVDRVQSQSFRSVSLFGLSFAAKRAQPAIPEWFLKSSGRSSGGVFVNAANSSALDHRLFCFESKAGNVASIKVLTGLVPFLRGILNCLASWRAILLEIRRSFHSLYVR